MAAHERAGFRNLSTGPTSRAYPFGTGAMIATGMTAVGIMRLLFLT